MLYYEKFASPIQIKKLDNPEIRIENVTITFPICFQSMVLKEEDIFNE